MSNVVDQQRLFATVIPLSFRDVVGQTGVKTSKSIVKVTIDELQRTHPG